MNRIVHLIQGIRRVSRKHGMERRVKRQEDTHQRIVEVVVELHKTLGMAPTVVRAISEKAGVERLTVYGHSLDERALFSACSGHYTAAYPPPDRRRGPGSR